jgi:hypothetical protein
VRISIEVVVPHLIAKESGSTAPDLIPKCRGSNPPASSGQSVSNAYGIRSRYVAEVGHTTCRQARPASGASWLKAASAMPNMPHLFAKHEVLRRVRAIVVAWDDFADELQTVSTAPDTEIISCSGVPQTSNNISAEMTGLSGANRASLLEH